MEWASLYDKDCQPSAKQINEYVASPFWQALNGFLQQSYHVEPAYAYSGCSAQPGWNVKYQKAGRSLCTLYPMEGGFIALVVIGNKEQAAAELLLPMLSPYVQQLYASSACVMGGRWLMIQVRDERILNDVKQLIQVRRPITAKRPTA